MSFGEPGRDWQDQQHQRILGRDATAFAELCEQALPQLVNFLRSQFPQVDGQLLETVAIDCLLGYHANPAQYRSGGISLYAYLRMAARYDALNALDSTQRHERRLTGLEALEATQKLHGQVATVSEEQELDDWLHQYTSRPLADIVKTVEGELDEVEKKVLWLMLQGERSAQAYVDVLGLGGLGLSEQRSEVARVKERLVKKLRRLGNRLKRT